jgi:hypothetical protein
MSFHPWSLLGLRTHSARDLRRGSLWALALASGLSLPTAQAAGLPDTGQDTCYNGSSMVACDTSNTGDGSTYPRQDGRFGRDPAFAQGAFAKIGAGQKGFDYTKLDAFGNPLAIQNGTWAASGGYDSGSEAAGTKWSCVTDNITQLTWEVKTHDATPGLREMNNTYTWYNSDSSSNSGNAGSLGSNTCNGTLSAYSNLCNTQNYVAAVNAAHLCGYSDWRLPSYRELSTLVHAGTSNPSIDWSYFPNTPGSYFWTASSYAPGVASAWIVIFGYGHLSASGKADTYYARLVRGGQF